MQGETYEVISFCLVLLLNEAMKDGADGLAPKESRFPPVWSLPGPEAIRARTSKRILDDPTVKGSRLRYPQLSSSLNPKAGEN